MKKVYFVFAYLIVLIFAFVAPVARAETHITDQTPFNEGAVWTKDASPYIIDSDIYVPRGVALYIQPGVIVTTSSSSPGSLSIGGTFNVYGTSDQPVTINNLTNLSILFSTSTISHAFIDVPTGLDIIGSDVSISSSTITDADKGIDIQGSKVDVVDSVIFGNRYGIYSHHTPPPIFQAVNFFGNFFNVPAAYAQTIADLPKENHITISNSSISKNILYAVYNSIDNAVSAENNWWGRADGPGDVTSVNGLFGNIDYVPWLETDPTLHQKSVCCSNVLFLPGLEASRLYLDKKTIVGTSTNELWEPNRNDDVRKLFMTSAGQSVNAGIYTKDIIDSAFGLFPIYKGFIDMMNGAVADKTINSWVAYPYDWRFDAGTIISQKLIDVVQLLASTSKTGKVTIVAHSDGGLVAKLLAKAFADKGESNLFDKIILVAVPQLGTPEAVAALLHGDDQSILGGLIMNQSVARQLGENIPGAYGLLPSRDYFSNLTGSIISFASSALADFNLSGNQQTISSYDALRTFLAGISDHRAKPSDSGTDLPSLLHVAMIDGAQKIHDTADALVFASTTKTIILAGWGKPTLTGISYYGKDLCSDVALISTFNKTPTCVKMLEHSASTTIFGDNTVVMDSAAAPIPNSSDYYLDLGSEDKGKEGHSTILNTDSGIAFVKQQVTEISTTSDSTLPPYISDRAPTMADVHQDDLVVSVHSPVELNMYDNHGNHTGPIPNPDPTSDLGRFETNIPGSEYVPNDGDTYIRVPYATDYKVTFTGTGMGSFEVDTEHDVNGVDATNTTFADMPVTPLLKAELILATSTPTTTQMMLFDFNGDGVIDATSTPHSQYDPILDMQSYQTIIASLNLSPAKEKIMHDKIGIIIDCLRKKKPLKEVGKPDVQAISAARQGIADLQNQHWIFKNLDPIRKQKIESIFQAFLDDVDVQ